MVKVVVSLLIIIALFILSLYIYFQNRPPVATEVINRRTTGAFIKDRIESEKSETSGSDLSSIFIVADEFVDIKLTDVNSSSYGVVILEEPIADPAGEAESTVETVNTLYFSKPKSGTYFVTLLSPKDFTADFYFYDRNGEVNAKKIDDKGDVKYRINFDKENSQNSILSSQR